jgi:hypothetical protein
MFLRVKSGRRVGLTTLPPSVRRMSENVGALTSRNPKGLHGLYKDNLKKMSLIITFKVHKILLKSHFLFTCCNVFRPQKAIIRQIINWSKSLHCTGSHVTIFTCRHYSRRYSCTFLLWRSYCVPLCVVYVGRACAPFISISQPLPDDSLVRQKYVATNKQETWF